MRPTDICPAFLADLLITAYKADKDWLTWEHTGPGTYRVCLDKCPQAIRRIAQVSADYLGLKAMSSWLANGPKIFRPNAGQMEALANVDVNISLLDYSQPYPAIYIEADVDPFRGVLCYTEPGMLVCSIMSKDNQNDITTTIGGNAGELIEKSLATFHPDCKDVAPQAHKILRIACNACLALSNWGTRLDYLFPNEVSRDRKTIAKNPNSDLGRRARQRIQLATQVISFDQEIRIHHTHDEQHTSNNETGRSVSVHWRRGHWAMQPYGPGRSLRKRILRPPVLVRSDLFTGDLSNTQATYKP